MLRIPNQTQNATVETTRAELNTIDGNKRGVQIELDSIIENKRRIEKEYEARRREITDDLAIVKRESEMERDKLLAVNFDLKRDSEKLAEQNRVIRVATAALNETHSAIERDSSQARSKLGILIADIEKSRSELSQIKQGIDLLSPELQTLTNALTNGRAELKGVELAKLRTTEKLSTLDAEHSTKSADHEEFVRTNTSEKGARTAELSDIQSQIAVKSSELKVVSAKVAELEATVTAYRDEFEKKDAEITTRMKAATNLETHVQEKLESLKTLESAFTTQHLARFGYKKTE